MSLVPEYLTPAQAAAYLGYSKSSLDHWRLYREGPPYIKLETGRIRYSRTALDSFMAKLTMGKKQ